MMPLQFEHALPQDMPPIRHWIGRDYSLDVTGEYVSIDSWSGQRCVLADHRGFDAIRLKASISSSWPKSRRSFRAYPRFWTAYLERVGPGRCEVEVARGTCRSVVDAQRQIDELDLTEARAKLFAEWKRQFRHRCIYVEVAHETWEPFCTAFGSYADLQQAETWRANAVSHAGRTRFLEVGPAFHFGSIPTVIARFSVTKHDVWGGGMLSHHSSSLWHALAGTLDPWIDFETGASEWPTNASTQSAP